MKKSKDRSPSMQFYFRQFSGDENVCAMDLDTVGAHILLMCYAGASPFRHRIVNNRDKIRRLLRQKDDENFSRIWAQLQEGAWKVSEDGEWLEQAGMLRALKKQKEFSRLQQERAAKRWNNSQPEKAMPDGCRIDAGTEPEVCSSSSSSSTSSLDILSKDNIYISPPKSEPLKIEVLKPKKQPESKPWPPEGEERRPLVFLTQAQCVRIYQHMEPDEFDYWLDELSDYARLRPAYWKKTYKDHALVILKWRKMKLEKGFVWNPTEKGYRYPKVNKDKTQNLDWKKEWYEEQRQRIANDLKD